MEQFLYTIKPTRLAMLTEGGTPDENQAMGAHFQYLKELTASGTVILAGPTLVLDERNFGIVVFQAEDEAAARAIMEHDPSVRAGVMHAELYPFRVSLLAGRD